MDKKIDEGVHQCFGHVERMENNRIDKRVYVGECAGSCSVGRTRKKWNGTMKDCLKQKVLDSGKQGELCMIGVCEGECIGTQPRG